MTKKQKTTALLFLISQGISLLGSQTVALAVVWYFTVQTGSGALVAALSVASYLLL